jgi:hypothetical protein
MNDDTLRGAADLLRRLIAWRTDTAATRPDPREASHLRRMEGAAVAMEIAAEKVADEGSGK